MRRWGTKRTKTEDEIVENELKNQLQTEKELMGLGFIGVLDQSISMVGVRNFGLYWNL
jgi:hypothetical protein